VERLSQRIDELLCDRDQMRETSRRARQTVAANFTWERCGQQTLEAYEHVLR
jgi:teichuronic acid biosynthesis glycosyltransferase TuaC